MTMQTQDCTYGHAVVAGTPVITDSHCETVGTTTVSFAPSTGTTTVAIVAPVVAYNPFSDVVLGTVLTIGVAIAVALLIKAFR